MREKLASIPIGDGREAAIWREDDGTTRWTAETRGWAITGPYVPVVLPVPDGTLVAGELPPDAETVEVRAPVEPRGVIVAAGHYVAVVPIETMRDAIAVVARDRTGAIVQPPPPEPPRSRRRPPPAEPDPPLPDEVTLSEMVEAVPFPVYGLADAETESFGYGWSDDGIYSAHLNYNDLGIDVVTDVQQGGGSRAKWRARIAISNAVRQGHRLTGRSDELLLETLGRVDRAGADEIEIEVDGRATAFTRFSDGTTSAAAAVIDEATVQLVSRDRPLDGLRLQRL